MVKNAVIIQRFLFCVMLFFAYTHTNLLAQDKKNYFSLGGKKWGLGFGYSKDYTGLRFNLIDYSLERITGISIILNARGGNYIRNNNLLEYNKENVWTNGISFSLIETPFKKVNGISIGLFADVSPRVNGISIGGIALASGLGFVDRKIENKYGRVQNGIAISSLLMSMRKGNGLIITGVYLRADTLRGLICSLLIEGKSDNAILQGVAISGDVRFKYVDGIILAAGSDVKNMNGVQIGLINEADNIRGFQFGLINHVRNNPKLLRWLPLFNTNFRKKI